MTNSNNLANIILPILPDAPQQPQPANGAVIGNRAIWFYHDRTPVGRILYDNTSYKFKTLQGYLPTGDTHRPWARTKNTQEFFNSVIGRTEIIPGNLGLQWNLSHNSEQYNHSVLLMLQHEHRPFHTLLNRTYRAGDLARERDALLTNVSRSVRPSIPATHYHAA